MAFEWLFRAYAERLAAFADQYVNSPEVAEEIVQDLFYEIWRDRAAWHPASNVRAYLYRSARNRALDYLKHEDVVAEWKRQVDVDETRSPASARRQLEQQELERAVSKAISELPERRRLVFLLSRRHDMTYREIAQALGISVKTVETQMGRAFDHLRKHLSHWLPVALLLF